MLLNENWMKWDNWLFVCCALGDPIIAGLYWISCKLLIVIRLEIKKSEKVPIFFSMTLPYFCCLGSEVIILSEIEKYPTSCCIFRWSIKRILLWRLCKFLFPVYVLYSSIKRLFLLRFCKFFPLFLSDPCPIIVYPCQ